MTIFLQIYTFLLPFHAVFITFFKCKMGIDMDFLRFWKEFIILGLFGIVIFKTLFKNKFNFEKIYKDNYLLGTSTAFILCSFVYIFFPYFDPKLNSFLGFKYDVFFIFAFLIGLYLVITKEMFEKILKSLFASIATIILIFLPWFVFGDISHSSELLGYNKEVSVYEANSCISFSQNVSGGYNRFQGSFGDPIRFSVFLVVFYFIYVGFILNKEINNKKLRNSLLIIPSILVFLSIFLSYTKTSMLGLLFGIILFVYLVRKIKFGKEITKNFLIKLSILATLPIIYLSIFKRDLFLHPEAILGRVDNLTQSVGMFFYNPFGYGLGIAGPASQLATSGEKFMSDGIVKFLPENWYVQILLEQGILGLAFFIGFLLVVVNYLYKIIKIKKDYLSISIFVSFVTILFMANFTHIFEESSTSFTLYLLVGSYIGIMLRKNHI